MFSLSLLPFLLVQEAATEYSDRVRSALDSGDENTSIEFTVVWLNGVESGGDKITFFGTPV